MNESMLAKALWKLAANSNSQWVQLVMSKYLPKSKLWKSKRVYNCTAFWRALMNLREKLLPLVRWSLGNGKTCLAFGDPWFPDSTDIVPQTSEQRNMKVSDLIASDTGSWNVELLISLFGYTNSITILNQVRPVNPSARKDTLVFSQTKSGAYSVKMMYRHLQGQGNNTNSVEKDLWQAIWKKGDVVPRVRVFLWRLLSNGLPLTNTLAHRGIAIENVCCSCGEAQEDGKHLVFDCPFSRACWFGAPFPLRSHLLQGTIKEIFEYLINGTDAEQWTWCANTIWAIWRCRNDMIYNAQQPTHLKFKGFLHAITSESDLARDKAIPYVMQNRQHAHMDESDYYCYSDGSWSSQWDGGIGFVVLKQSQLIQYHSAMESVCSPMEAEAKALLLATQQVLSLEMLRSAFSTQTIRTWPMQSLHLVPLWM